MSLLKEVVASTLSGGVLTATGSYISCQAFAFPNLTLQGSSDLGGQITLVGDNVLTSGGNLQIVVNGVPKRIVTLSAPAPLMFVRTAHYQAVNSLTSSVASGPAAPTTTTRKIYLLGMMMAQAWTRGAPVSPAPTAKLNDPTQELKQATKSFPAGASISGTRDTWNFNQRGNLRDDVDQMVWFVHTLGDLILPKLIPSYSAAALYAQERAYMNWTEEEQAAAVARVKEANNYAAFVTALNRWWSYRSQDGYDTSAAVPPTLIDLPNIATPLVVNANADPGASSEWTPLQLASGTTQSYLGYHWTDVRTTCLTADQQDACVAVAAPFYPDEAQRAAEIAEVKDMTAALTDEQKMIAELWAGGPMTTTPPGMFAWLWADYMSRFAVETNDSTAGEVDAQVLSFLDLGISLFEGSRMIWDIKTAYKQCRPIQEIRHRYFGTNIESWNGTVPAGSWVPYQMPNFVTPPFADFSSGHSYFSQAFANVMTNWFGDTIGADSLPIVTKTFSQATLKQLSPIFVNAPAESELKFAQFIVPTGGSEIQPDVVPAAPITFEFSTWAEMAAQVGVSRLYGGIHCWSAHNASVAVADALYPVLQSDWNIQVQ